MLFNNVNKTDHSHRQFGETAAEELDDDDAATALRTRLETIVRPLQSQSNGQEN